MSSGAPPPLGKLWPASLWLAAIGGWLALIWTLAAPSETGSAFLWGYSVPRMAMAALLLAAALFFTLQSVRRSDQTAKRLVEWSQTPVGFPLLLVGASLILGLCWILLFLPDARAGHLLGPLAGYLPRLQPLLVYSLLLNGLLLAHLLALRFGFQTEALKRDRPLWRAAVWVFAALLGLWALIALTGLGLGFDITEWNAPGASLLSSQVLLSMVLGLALTAIVAWFVWRWGANRVDLGLFLLIWLAAALLWLAQPAGANYYSSPLVAPNYEPYPVSDAFNHDVIANNLLIGEDFRFGGLRAVRKPLYAAFLASLHLVSGGDYSSLIDWQVVVLALFPAALFLLGRRMHGRLAGLILASLVILREANAIRLGHVINLSHAKLLMADLPAALALALFALLAFHWLSRRPAQSWMALAAGAAAGLLLLLRSQNLTLIPAILLLAFLTLRRKQIAWRPLLTRLLLFVLGVALAAAPWLLRNRALTGQFIIEQSTAAGYLAQRYSEDPDEVLVTFLPNEPEGEYYARHMAQVKEFIFEHPQQVAGFVADNYLRNLYLSVMPLPLSLELRDLHSHVLELPYWPSWDGRLLPETWLPLTANLALVAVGLAAAWRRWGWAGLVPLAINLGFTLNLALARVSGWRYNQPVDWTLILYFALGLAQVLIWGFALLGRAQWLKDPVDQKAERQPAHPTRALLLAAVLALALGCALLALEALTSPQYDGLSPSEAAQHLDLLGEGPDLQAMLRQGQVDAVHGAALYPRYYLAGEGTRGSEFLLTAARSFDRLTFFLLGPRPGEVLLPTSAPIEAFTSGSEVLVFQCVAGRSRVVAVLDLDMGRLYSAPLDQQCGGL